MVAVAASIAERTIVRNADDMDADTFLKHLRFRHPEYLAGRFPAFATEYVEGCYRRYHDQLHGLLDPDFEVEHEHGRPHD